MFKAFHGLTYARFKPVQSRIKVLAYNFFLYVNNVSKLVLMDEPRV